MDKNLNRTKDLKFHLIYISFVFSLTYMFGIAIKLELSLLVQILLISSISLLVEFFLLNPLILFLVLGTIALGGFLVNHYITPFLPILIERLSYLFYNIGQNLKGNENIALDNLVIFWGLLIIIVSVFTAFIIFKDKNVYWLLPLYIGSFLYYWYTFFDEAYWILALFLLCFFIFIGLDNYFKKGKDKIWNKTVLIYSLLIVFLSMILPKTNSFIQSQWLHQKAYSLFPSIGDLRHSDDSYDDDKKASLFNFSITGFQSEPSRLGGPVILNNKKIMSVVSDSPAYLRGNVRHIYTGISWESIKEPWKTQTLNEDFSKISEEDKKLYYKRSSIKITNHSFSSTTLFSPYLPTKVNIPEDYEIIISPDNALVFRNGIYNNESYRIQIEEPLPYGVLVSLGIDRKKEDLDLLDVYLQVPDDKITQRTKSLVKNIVKGLETDFEKATAIESYLRSNYEYSLNVESIPEDQEFIDYFLFEEGKGYCTYYATTMALMLRMEGIPSRYVEGYLAKDLLEDGVYEVKQSNAHTWVEAFIEPVGWMTFEATPAFPLEPRLENYEAIGEDLETTPENNLVDNQSPDKIIEEPERYREEDFLDGEVGSYENLPDEPDLVKSNITIEDILKILLLIIVFRVITSFFIYKYKEFKVNRLPNDEKLIHYYADIISILKTLGYPQESGETHFEYAKRVAHKFSRFQEKGFIEITEIFVENKYGNTPTLDRDILDLEVYRKSLDNNLKNKLGRINYYYQKYIKVKI